MTKPIVLLAGKSALFNTGLCTGTCTGLEWGDVSGTRIVQYIYDILDNPTSSFWRVGRVVRFDR